MSITVALFAHRPPPYPARHAAAAALPLAALASRFLRWARPRTAEEGRAAPHPPRGAALLRPESHPYPLRPSVLVRDMGDGHVIIGPDEQITIHPATAPGEYLPATTMPRRRLIAGKPPWQTAAMPLLREPEPEGPSRAWDPGDSLGPMVPLARPYVAPPQDAYPCCVHCVGFVCDRPYHGTPCDEGCEEAR